MEDFHESVDVRLMLEEARKKDCPTLLKEKKHFEDKLAHVIAWGLRKLSVPNKNTLHN